MEEFWKSIIDLLSGNTVVDGERLRLSWNLDCQWEQSVSQNKLTEDMQDIYDQLRSIACRNEHAEVLLNDFTHLCEVSNISL